MIVLFLIVMEITVVCTLTVCGVIALLTLWDWIMFQIKEEIRIVEMQDGED